MFPPSSEGPDQNDVVILRDILCWGKGTSHFTQFAKKSVPFLPIMMANGKYTFDSMIDIFF